MIFGAVVSLIITAWLFVHVLRVYRRNRCVENKSRLEKFIHACYLISLIGLGLGAINTFITLLGALFEGVRGT